MRLNKSFWLCLLLIFLVVDISVSALTLRDRIVTFKQTCETESVAAPISEPIAAPLSMAMSSSMESEPALTPEQQLAEEMIEILQQLFDETDNIDLRNMVISYLFKAYRESPIVNNTTGS